MDAKKLGQFIAEIRKEKEMTQAELASELHVTDKAVSKWERGLGLPDINSIEPLADALGISVAEVMQAERIPDAHVTQENASEMLTNAFDIMKQQRKLERKHHTLILVGVLLAIVLLFLGDTMGWMGMFFVVAPCLCVALAISLVYNPTLTSINDYWKTWTLMKAKHQRIDAFKLWCWRRLL